jgi:thiosulfate reductase cytochrome b subunit
VTLSLGGVFSQSRSFQTTGTAQISSDFDLEANYGYRFLYTNIAALYGEIEFVALPNRGVLSVLTRAEIWKPVQFPWLAWVMGGFRWARLWHFLIMWALLAFVFGHLVMVVLHGWNNFVSMLTGWKKDPDYVPK